MKTLRLRINLDGGGLLVVGTAKNSPVIAALKIDNELSKLGGESFIVRSSKLKIAAPLSSR